MDRYILEFYEPDDFKTALHSFSSDAPFLSIHVGDIIDPGSWPGYKPGDKFFRVTGVKHIVFDGSKDFFHKICVYVAEIKDARDYLLTGKQN